MNDKPLHQTDQRCVAVTGSTGFVGRHVLATLLGRGRRVRALLRDPAKLPQTTLIRDALADNRLTTIQGSLFDQDSLLQLLEDSTAVIHLVGIIREMPRQGQTFERIHHEGTVRLLEAARCAQVRRWVQMSALGTRADAASAYFQTKWQAEQAVRDSDLDWTIFRPSIIHGPDGEFTQMVRDFWTRLLPPFVPYFGKGVLGLAGAGRLQPVYVDDVAACFVKALDLPQTIGQTYDLGGPQVVTWPQMYRMIRKHLTGTLPKPVAPVPVWLAMTMASAKLPGLPFNRDQVIMSREDSTCDITAVEQTFDIKLQPVEETLAQYASQLTD